MMWRLRRQLPGRRKAGQKWTQHLAKVLVSLDFEQSAAAPQFFVKRSPWLGLEAHMDDMHVVGSRISIEEFTRTFSEQIDIKGGLPIEIGVTYTHLKRFRLRTNDVTYLWPNLKYLDNTLQLMNMQNAKPAATPSVMNFSDKLKDSPLLDESDVQVYRSALGSMIFYGLDREDVQGEINILGAYLQHPTAACMAALKRVLRYLLGTRDGRIEMHKPTHGEPGKVLLEGSSDADWGDEQATRRSKTSGHIEADGCPLYGFVRRQGATATSSAVAEFYAATGVSEELLLFKEILTFFGYVVDCVLLLDANAAKGISMRLGCGRIKHLEVRSLWLQEAVARLLLRVGRIPSLRNPADLGTKVFSADRLQLLRQLCGYFLPGEANVTSQHADVKAVTAGPSSRCSTSTSSVGSSQCDQCVRLRRCIELLTTT